MQVAVSPFRTVARWDVGYNAHREGRWRGDTIRAFGDVARRRVVELAAGPDSKLGSIHFDGLISVRTTARGAGRLFGAHANDLVFSKIDARNGAIGLVPRDSGNLAFSSEFPVYEIDQDQLLPSFLQILCRTSRFRAMIQARVVGHSGRKRLSPDLLEGLPIPVPPTQVQARIVAQIKAAELARTITAAEADRLRVGSYDLLAEQLGIPDPETLPTGPVFPASWASLSSWSVKRVRLDLGYQAVRSHYAIRMLGEPSIAEIAYGISKSPANRPGANARPYLRVANVQAGELDLSEIKYIEVGDDQVPRFALQPGDLLLCEGNSEALVGRPAIWRGEIDGCVHQNHVIRVRLNVDRFLPEFVMHYMSTRPARAHFLSRAKRTTNLASISGTDVSECPMPEPPLDVQRDLARLVADRLSGAQRLAHDAESRLSAALESVERELVEN